MESRDIWDGSALTESDKTLTKVRYEGSPIAANSFICAVSNSSLSLINAITEKSRPVGHFIVELYDINEPCQYANGNDSEINLIKSLKNPVILMDNICLISFEHNFRCSHDIVRVFYETFKPKNVIVLDSMHQSLFHGKTEVPSLYILSENVERPKLPLPNLISGLSAGLLNYSTLYNANCRIWEMIEEDFGPSSSSYKIWAAKINEILPLDISAIVSRAVTLNHIRENGMGLVYT